MSKLDLLSKVHEKKDDESFKTDADKDLLTGKSNFMRKLLEALFLFLNFGIAMVRRMIA